MANRGKSKRNELTPKQTEVLKHLVNGLSNKETSVEIGCSVKTIDAHRAAIMTRLQIFNLAGLVKYAVKNNLTDLVAA